MSRNPIPLSEIVRRRGPIGCRTAAEWIGQAAKQLERAHQHGVVHGHVNPDTLQLDGNGIVIADVYLAMATPPDQPSRANRTVLNRLFHAPQLPKETFPWAPVAPSGTTVSAIDYLAPECAIDEARADWRRDIYSLGCTFYYLLAARPVFVGGTLAQTLLMHQYDPPQPIRELRADVPTSLWQIIERMLDKRPEDRFGSAADVAAALNEWLANN